MVTIWLADRFGIRLRLCYRLSEFPLAGTGCVRFGGPCDPDPVQTIQRRDRVSIPGALLFDGRGGLCYIQCFSRESLWAFCGLVSARWWDCVRSGLRTVRIAVPRFLNSIKVAERGRS